MNSLRRWLKIARAEAYRDFITSIRYPMEVLTGLFILYIFFMGVYTGSKVMAGGGTLSGSQDVMIIAFTMWFLAIMAINTMSVDIESEARQGTLEQVYLHAPNYLGLLWVRGIIHLVYGAWVVVALSVLIQLTTRHWLPLGWGHVLPLIGAAAVGVTGLCGVGLMLGALSLVFKRIGQLAAILQFGLFFLACIDVSKLPAALQAIAPHLPLIGLVGVVKLLVTPGADAAALQTSFMWLLLDSAIYAVLGSLVFMWAERTARRAGSLSHY
jgi:ABC-2 type transport system permease protein